MNINSNNICEFPLDLPELVLQIAYNLPDATAGFNLAHTCKRANRALSPLRAQYWCLNNKYPLDSYEVSLVTKATNMHRRRLVAMYILQEWQKTMSTLTAHTTEEAAEILTNNPDLVKLREMITYEIKTHPDLWADVSNLLKNTDGIQKEAAELSEMCMKLLEQMKEQAATTNLARQQRDAAPWARAETSSHLIPIQDAIHINDTNNAINTNNINETIDINSQIIAPAANNGYTCSNMINADYNSDINSDINSNINSDIDADILANHAQFVNDRIINGEITGIDDLTISSNTYGDFIHQATADILTNNTKFPIFNNLLRLIQKYCTNWRPTIFSDHPHILAAAMCAQCTIPWRIITDDPQRYEDLISGNYQIVCNMGEFAQQLDEDPNNIKNNYIIPSNLMTYAAENIIDSFLKCFVVMDCNYNPAQSESTFSMYNTQYITISRAPFVKYDIIRAPRNRPMFAPIINTKYIVGETTREFIDLFVARHEDAARLCITGHLAHIANATAQRTGRHGRSYRARTRLAPRPDDELFGPDCDNDDINNCQFVCNTELPTREDNVAKQKIFDELRHQFTNGGVSLNIFANSTEPQLFFCDSPIHQHIMPTAILHFTDTRQALHIDSTHDILDISRVRCANPNTVLNYYIVAPSEHKILAYRISHIRNIDRMNFWTDFDSSWPTIYLSSINISACDLTDHDIRVIYRIDTLRDKPTKCYTLLVRWGNLPSAFTEAQKRTILGI